MENWSFLVDTSNLKCVNFYNTLFKYIIHKHNTRYIFEKEDREVIPIKDPLTEL